MDLQTRKMHFIQEFLRIRNENLVEKLENLLRIERKRILEEKIKPMSLDDFNKMIDMAEKDSVDGKVTSAKDLKKNIDLWS